MAEFRLSPAAQSDLDGIFDYTVQQWGLEQAVRYTQAVERACATLAEAPAQAQNCSHIRPVTGAAPQGGITSTSASRTTVSRSSASCTSA